MEYFYGLYIDENTDEVVKVKAAYDLESKQVTIFNEEGEIVMIPDEVFDNESEPAVFDSISKQDWEAMIQEAKRLNNDISMFLFG